VSAETVLRWTRRGDLPGFRLPGGALRFREDDLEQWLNGRATAGSEVRQLVNQVPKLAQSPAS
jgi:excisionase family DNA binding protein